MKVRTSFHERYGSGDNSGSSKWGKNFTKMKNLTRLGGGGLSLEAFTNAKSKNKDYNPALIKKRREFYRNAKFVSRYKRSLKNSSSSSPPVMQFREEDTSSEKTKTERMRKKRECVSLRALYEKKRDEMEKSRTEREAANAKKMEDLKQVNGERKIMKQKMMRKTEWGQPLMKHRLEKLLKTIHPT